MNPDVEAASMCSSTTCEKPALKGDEGTKTTKTPSYLRNWILFCLIGCINNLPYVIVLAAAPSIVSYYNSEKLYGIVGWANVALGLVGRLLATWMGEFAMPYRVRFILNTVLIFLSILITACGGSFWVCMIGVLLCGLSSAFGENTVLGYIRFFDPTMTGAWSSGTGWAGVVGSGGFLLLNSVAGLDYITVLYIFLPTSLVYVVAYYLLVPSYPVIVEKVSKEKNESWRGTLSRYSRCLKLTWWIGFNLGLVYFLEYGNSGRFARDANPVGLGNPQHLSHSDKSLHCAAYEILQFCYQVGVLISRSALPFLKKIPGLRFEYLTATQALLFLLWLFESRDHFIPVGVQFFVMVIVGLLGGAMYVWVFYRIQVDDKYPDLDKELCINIVTIFINFGIVAYSLITFALDNTIWPPFDNRGCTS